jgi:16S rRNA (cytosine967-C5)-methyltransferase
VVTDAGRVPLREASFDRVLLDAPCSGLGVLRRRAEARWRVRPDDVVELAALQRRLLLSAASSVRPGGRLVYAVCTLTPEETLGVDEHASGALGAFAAVEPPGPPWRAWGRGALLLPGDAGTDGMFVLVLERAVR